MTTDRLLTDGARPAVRIERRYPHPIEKVWRAVTEPEHLSRWFASPVEFGPEGALRFSAFAEGEGGTGQVVTLDPPHLFVFLWDTEEIRIELTEASAETVVVLTHTFDDRPLGASLAVGWGACLAGLGAVVAGEPLPPESRMIDEHEELVRAFGLDQPELTEGPEGWSARFDRQLTCPADVARGLVSDCEFDEHVRVDFLEGSGHGTRLVLQVEGTGEPTVERWQREVERIAAQAAAWAHTAGAAGVSA
jgi:uncharacterized protein YndB with AHSA1/START domain